MNGTTVRRRTGEGARRVPAAPDGHIVRGEAVVGGDQSTASRAGSASAAGEAPALSAEDLPDGVLVADRHGKVITFNRLARRLTRLSSGAALGRDFRDVLPLHDADGRDWWKHSDPYGGLRIRTRQPERTLFLADGREILMAARYVRDSPCGDVCRLVVTMRDASYRVRGERNRAEIVSTVAHELRSPLTSVKGFTATLLAKWERLTEKQKIFMLETVNADADRVTRLVTELLDVSRIESGRLEVRRQVVDLPECARRVIAGRVAAGEAEDRFRLEANDPLPEMWLDPDKLEQIMANLVEKRGTARRWYCHYCDRAPRGRSSGVGARRRQGHSARSHSARFPPVLAQQAARRHRLGPVHRQGSDRGPRRHDHGWPRALRRRRVSIYCARRYPRVRLSGFERGGGRAVRASLSASVRCASGGP